MDYKDILLMQYKLKNALQENGQKKRKLSKSGRLEPSRLAHAKTSGLIFSQPIPNTGKEYKATIILDVSGSMYNYGRIKPAIISVQNLIKLFDGVIDFNILVFGEGYYSVSKNFILSLDVNYISRSYRAFENTFYRKFGRIYRNDGLCDLVINEEGEPITWGTMSKAPLISSANNLAGEVGGKYVFLLTDGKDNGCSTDLIGGIDISLGYNEIEKLYEGNDIELLPIGMNIELDNFKNSLNISSPTEIYDEVINFINNKEYDGNK